MAWKQGRFERFWGETTTSVVIGACLLVRIHWLLKKEFYKDRLQFCNVCLRDSSELGWIVRTLKQTIMARNKKEDDTAGKHHSGLESKTGTPELSGKNAQFNSGSGGVPERNTHRTGAGSQQSEIRGQANESSSSRRVLADHTKKSVGKNAAATDDRKNRH
jgi:hypothetical protein